MSDETDITTTIGKRPQITVDRLRSLLTFEPATDQFIWRVARGRARAGDVAGTGHHTGFRRIGIDGGSYRADRLASLYVARQHDGTDHRGCPG